MTANDPDSPVRRMAIAIAAAVAILAVAGSVYYFMPSKETTGKFNGAAIVAAARDYTRDVRLHKQPLPNSVTLNELVNRHYLQPEQVEAFRGTKATIILSTQDQSPRTVLMQVQMPDGSQFRLLNDGSVQEASR